MSKDGWVINEVQSANFGDKRLNNRFTNILNSFSTSPGLSVSSSCKGWSETLAAYRFINNTKVSSNSILSPHTEATLDRVKQENVVLILQDTTEIDFTGHNSLSDMGYLSTIHSKGFYLHPSIAVTPDKRCLGVLDIQSWNRHEIGNDKKRHRANLPIEEKETYCWIKGYDVANKVAISSPNTAVINVADREGYIYDLLAKQPSEHNKAYWLIRAKHNRKISSESDVKTRLWEKVKLCESIGNIEFSLTDGISYRNSSRRYRNKRSARVVKQEIRTCSISLSPPKHIKQDLADITINAVHCIEIDTPEGEKPIEWLLLTTYPVTDKEAAYQIVKWYLCRWQIEIFFKILKSGCRVEELQFSSFQATLNCISIYSIIAWRILYMTMEGRQNPDINCEAIFERSEWQAAYSIGKGEIPPETPPSLNEIIKLISEFGGHLGRKSDKPPGPKIMWVGMQRLRDFTIAWEAFHSLKKRTCV
jgi:hypothetical protein